VAAGVLALGLVTRGAMRSVADFLSAGRSAGRYLITISYGVANIGAITVLAFFEQNYEAGATLLWWEPILQIALLGAMLSGWVVYRFRRTRCLTLAEFFERRYSRGFRVFAGLLAFTAGVLNFAIFPLVGAKFFVVFCGLPAEVALFGAMVPTHVPLMVLLLGTALWFVFTGGQVSVLTTDFAQGVFANVVFVVIAVFLLAKVGWGDVAAALAQAPAGQSRIDPLDTAAVQHFGLLFFVISMVEVLYGQMSWQGEQAYFSSARTAHEARMGGVLRLWFLQIRLVFFLVVPLVAYAVLHADAWLPLRDAAEQTLAAVPDPQDAGRLRVPVVLALLLPPGLKGLMAAMMLAAFISTHTTYLHSWGSIFTQDVALPLLRRRGIVPSKRAHFRLLRGSVLLVAVLAFVYSAFLYSPTEPIMLYMAITGAIFLGWSGTAIIGGLYWRRGTTAGAWSAAVAGSVFTLGSFLLQRMNDALAKGGAPFFGWFGDSLPVAGLAERVAAGMPDGKEILGLTMVLCVGTYVIVSVAQNRRYDLDALLHRGAHALPGEVTDTGHGVTRLGRLLGFTREHTRGDRWTAGATAAFIGFWFLVAVIGTVWALTFLARGGTHAQMTGAWLAFWKWRIAIMLVTAAVVTVVLAAGGVKDLRRVFAQLRTAARDDADDGSVP
ncbi:MAG TPA: sodium:solute symporter, partial [Candidatus Krumholzibacteria bacterium]|nr:sodium:solute symporter [Candidatus Krumholzibacteria bacterium]